MDPEVCIKNAQIFEEKTWSKISCHYTWLLHHKTARLEEAFLEVFSPKASPVEGQSLQQKEKKERKRKGEEKFKNRKA